MMRPYGEDLKVYLCREPVDMRKARNGLAALAQEAMKLDPFSGALMVFVGRRFNAVKILYWSRNGFALWHKVYVAAELMCSQGNGCACDAVFWCLDNT
jgi:transposase